MAYITVDEYGKSWISAEPPEEESIDIGDVTLFGDPPPKPIDEMSILKAQNQALLERQEFLEDCISEMAMQVYS